MSSLKARRWNTAWWTAPFALILAGSSLVCLTSGCGVQTAADSLATKAESGTRLGEPEGVSPRSTPVAHAPGSPRRLPLSAARPPVVAPKPVPRTTAKSIHPPQNEMLRRLAARLHNEALAHFYSDPRNGRYRLPVVYERIVRKWTTPYFSPGELGTDEPIPHRDDLRKIHRSSLTDFTKQGGKRKAEGGKTTADGGRGRAESVKQNGEGGPATRFSSAFRLPPSAFCRKFDKNRKVWEVKKLDLVGLVLHREPVAYVSESRVPRAESRGPETKTSIGNSGSRPSTLDPRPSLTMDKLHAAPTRELDEFEYSGLSVLENGQDLYARSDHGVIRLLGAVRAKTSCLSCHTKHKPGDLLGAFSYTLREAEYKRGVKRFVPLPAPRQSKSPK
jgi:hypothetical protein